MPFEKPTDSKSASNLTLARYAAQVEAWLDNPHAYFRAFEATARAIQRKHPSPRLRIMTLVGKPVEFLPFKPLRIWILDTELKVGSWEEALAQTVGFLFQAKPETMRVLAEGGLLEWMKAPEGDLFAAHKAGTLELQLDSRSEVIRRLQGLALLHGIKLNELIVQVDPFTDDEWRRRKQDLDERKGRAPNPWA